MKNKNKEFAKEYRHRIEKNIDDVNDSNQLHLESALCNMITRFSEEIPPIQCERFHKTFRQNDVVDFYAPEGTGGALDMVFWHLLHCQCTVFWQLQGDWVEKMKEEEQKNKKYESELLADLHIALLRLQDIRDGNMHDSEWPEVEDLIQKYN